MTPEEHQAQLLDAYLNALSTDPEALPPPGLDPETAAFARLMMQTQQPVPSQAADRVWHRVQGALQAQVPRSPNGHTSITLRTGETTPMISTLPAQKPRRFRGELVALVAAMLAVIAAAAMYFGGGDNDYNPIVALQAPTETPIPTLTITPSPTFIPTSLPPTVPPPPAGGGGGGGGLTAEIAVDSHEFIFDGVPTGDIVIEDIVFGEPITGAFSATIDAVGFNWTAQEETSILTIVETEFGTPFTRIQIQGQNGGGGGGGPLNAPQIYRLNPGDDFTQVILAPPHGEIFATNGFTVRFEQIEPVPVAVNETLSGEITEENPYTAYAFDVAAGDVVTVNVMGENGFDTQVELLSQNFTLNGRDDDGGTGFDPELYRLTASRADTATLIISPSLAGTTGNFTAQITVEQTAMLEPGAAPISATLSQKAERVVYRMTGEPGEPGEVNVVAPEGDATFTVRISDGEQEIASSSGENVSQLARDFVFPASGEAFVTVAIGRYSNTNLFPNPFRVEVSAE